MPKRSTPTPKRAVQVDDGEVIGRNRLANTSRATAALEDSRGKPSRKSTRKSANRAKSGTGKERTAQLAVHAPSNRAASRRS